MSRQFQEYNGAVPQSAQVSGKQVPMFAGIPQNGEAVDRAVGAVLGTAERFARLHDLGVQQRATQKRKRLRSEMDTELQNSAEVAWGSEESLFRADGTLNQDRYDSIVAKYREKNEQIAPGDFLLYENEARYAGEQAAEHDDIDVRAMQFAGRMALGNIRKAYEDNYALAVAEENWDEAARLVNDARGSLLTDTQAKLELLKLNRGRLRGLGAAARSGVPQVVTLGGKEYSGANAALAMVAGEGEAKAEVPATAEVPQDGAMVDPQSAVLAPEEVELEGTGIDAQGELNLGAEPQLSVVGGQMVVSPNSLDAYTMLPESERIALVDDFTFDRKVLTMTDDMGKEHFSCPVTAPEAVQRVAAQAETKGELDVDTCRGMVARITMDAAVENPEVSTEQILKQFDDSGIYGALGAGDAEVGKARTRAIVEEMRQRAQAGTTKVNMATIERMVKAKVNEPTFGAGQEWKSMEALDPGLKKKDGEYPEWEKGDDAQRKKWFALYDVYKKYRADYNPYAEGEADRDDFNKHAGAFYEWYKENVYKPQKEAAQAAARDYYTAAVVEELTKSVLWSEGKAVYQGYANDVAVASEVLKRTLPNDLGVEALQAREAEAEREDALRTTRFREMAKEDYKKLHGLKQAEAENSAAAKKAREKQEDAERRKAEKEAREAEKQAEREESRRLFVARSQPRQANWAWDGANAPDGAQPLCTVPVEEYHRLQQELGYDGTQLVYLRVGNTKVLVVGTNDTGKIQLNTPAVLKIQAKPNAKKGEKWRVNGQLGYSYQFTNAK